jgi:hypothetical protein
MVPGEAGYQSVVRHQLRSSPPQLVLIRSPYGQFFERLLTWLRQLTATRPDRQVFVLIPELVQRRWYQFFVSHRAMRLRAQLLLKGRASRVGDVNALVS